MNRQEKEMVIESLKGDFSHSQASFVIVVQGMTVSQLQGLRKNIRAQGGQLKVAKNTLLKIATSDMPGIRDLNPYFKEQVGIVFVGQESPAVAKVLLDVSKENSRLVIVAGCLDTHVIGKDGVISLASLPPKEVLQAQTCGVLEAPLASFVGLLQRVVADFLWILDQASRQ